MADLGITYDPRDAEPPKDFEVLPVGKYLAIVSGSEFKSNSKGTGRNLSLTFQIIDGIHSNRLVWHNLSLENPSQTAVDIARSQLGAIQDACKVGKIQDSAMLHDIPHVITLKIVKFNDQPKNEIAKWEVAGGVAHATEPTAPAVTAVPAVAPVVQGEKPSWLPK
jgi:hypothetical protein